MQNGVVDGQENPVINVIQDLTYEVQKYMVLDGHTASIMMGVISGQWFNTLPADLQQIVIDGMNLGGEKAFELTQKLNRDGIATLREKGLQVYEPTPQELEEWHSIIYPATVSFVKNQVGDELVNRLDAEIKTYRAKK
jgi:TRAP-type C4-dicarboxylate transport system substrate-binding protein